ADRMELFALGMNDFLWSSRWNGTAWSAWLPVTDGALASDPAAVSVGNQTEVFARKADKRMYTIAVTGAPGPVWTPFGDQRFTGGPAAVSFGGRVHLFARGNARADRWIQVRSGRI